jgi:hypothetical protein
MDALCPHCRKPISSQQLARLLAARGTGKPKRFTPQERNVRRTRMQAINARRSAPSLMTRDSDLAFLEFCAQQMTNFSSEAWVALPRPNVQKATVALFLANMPWFGHQAELFALAARFHRGSVGRFSVLAERTGFSPSRFRNLLQSTLNHASLPRP